MNRNQQIELTKSVEDIIKILNSSGFKAYIVGGCVRDGILGLKPHDWDIATDAYPSDIKALFKKTVDTGIRHGTITIIENSDSFEVTTFRIDGEYSDNRRPDKVEFTDLIENDLARRDFTINAIAYHSEIGFIDPFGGIKDIEKRMINSVGNPDERFSEDALRMLRAIRFSAQLDFSISDNILKSITKNSSLIKNVSNERILEELTKILISPTPLKFKLLYETILLSNIMPEMSLCFETEQNHPSHVYNVGDHSLYSVANIDAIPLLRWAALFHDIGKPLVRTTDDKGVDHFHGHSEKSTTLALEIMKRLRFDNETAEIVARLVKNHDREIIADYTPVRRAVNRVGDDIFPYLLQIKRADSLAQSPQSLNEKLEHLDRISFIYNEIKESNQCISLKNLAVTGGDLLNEGFTEGKMIGETLDLLLNMVLENPELNDKESLLKYIKKND
ncbi:MAG: HD domain-containing protein [Clostridia bacterium]|jgi:tRNA nucleotidyltransferase (CCA-adding enzyme)